MVETIIAHWEKICQKFIKVLHSEPFAEGSESKCSESKVLKSSVHRLSL